MAATRITQSALLDQGGLATLYRAGGYWYVDVFDAEWSDGEDPVYHRGYAFQDEALEDFKSWKRWED